MSDTGLVRADERLDVGALAGYLRERLPGANGALTVEQFPGGHSNLTYLLSYPGAEYVLRRPPLGPLAPRAHDMQREYRVLDGLAGRYLPAPRPWAYCADAGVIGAPFYVMERRRGLVIRRDEPPELGGDPGRRRQASWTLVQGLADLHAVDWTAAGLADLGRPEGFVERQIRGWRERWERAKDREVPLIDEVAAWLAARVPVPPAATLVHGDYKFDNLMLDPADLSHLVAVLDWEMCTLGDPLVDLGLVLCYWPEAGDPAGRRDSVPNVTALPGYPTRREVAARYQALTGLDLSRIDFYEVFALYKIAVVVQQIYIRWKRGQTQDARFAAFAPRVDALVGAARALAERSGL